MAGKVTMTLPIYFGTKKKYMIGMNWYNTAHYRTKARVKIEFSKGVTQALGDNKLKSPIKTHYKVYYKNVKCDASNIVAVIDKFLMDALQEANVITEDNVRHYIKSSWEVMEQDKDNPRVEVIIEEDVEDF